MTLTATEYDALSTLLDREYGIDLSVMSKELVDQRIRRYCEQHQLASVADCVAHIESGPDRIQDLAELVYSNRTFFNRQPADFAFLLDAVRARLPLSPQPLTIWCLGCSTGQEAYTIAIYLLEHVWPAGEAPFHVDAGDCLQSALAYAREGRYPIEDIERLAPIDYRRYTVPAGDGHVRIAPHVKRHITFHPFNLVTSKYPPDGTVDVVFLRNALDFHGQRSQDAVLRSVRRILRTGGALVLGHMISLASATKVDICAYGYESVATGRYRAIPPSSPGRI